MVPLAARLNTRYRPPMLAFMLFSANQAETSLVVRVNPPEGTRPLIQAMVEPPAVRVSWISVPAAVVLVTAVADPETPGDDIHIVPDGIAARG